MYGVHTTSAGLQKYAANRLKEILESLTQKSYIAALFGVVMTVAFQSSTATTVLVVEFVNIGLMRLGQALGIVLGSALGTSISIQLIAFRILNIALALIFIGLIFYLFVEKQSFRHLGQGMIGFGLIFVGMAYMSEASAPFKEIQSIQIFLSELGHRPLLGILVGIGLTALMQSSTATVAIIISLAAQDLINLEAVIPLVLGAHTGGTVTTLISSIAATKLDARRVAVANTLYKVVGTILVFPFIDIMADILQWLSDDLIRQVANAHLLFSVFMLVIFLPLNPWFAKLLVKLIPDLSAKASGPQFYFIDKSSIEVPTVAITQSRLEIHALGQRMDSNIMRSIPEIIENNEERKENLTELLEDLKWYYKNISNFLTSILMQELPGEQREDVLHMKLILKEFEYIGETQLELRNLIMKLNNKNPDRYGEVWRDLEGLYEQVLNNYNRVLEALKKWDTKLAIEVIQEHPEILRRQRALQFKFLQTPETFYWDNLDVIQWLNRIDEHVVNIAQVILRLV